MAILVGLVLTKNNISLVVSRKTALSSKAK